MHCDLLLTKFIDKEIDIPSYSRGPELLVAPLERIVSSAKHTSSIIVKSSTVL